MRARGAEVPPRVGAECPPQHPRELALLLSRRLGEQHGDRVEISHHRVRRIRWSRRAEPREQVALASHEDVTGLDFPVSQPGGVHRRHGVEELVTEVDHRVALESPRAKPGFQRLARGVLQHDVEVVLDGAGVVHRRDAGMAERGQDPCLPQERLRARLAGRGGVHRTDEHRSSQRSVGRQIFGLGCRLIQHELQSVLPSQRRPKLLVTRRRAHGRHRSATRRISATSAA